MSEKYNWENGVLLNPPIFPKVIPEYQSLLGTDTFPRLEDLLMEHLETAPEDIAYYLPAYRVFIRKHDEKRAATILELHVESLKERGDHASEIILLQTVLSFWPDCHQAHRLLLDHLKTMYQSRHFKDFMQYCNVSDTPNGLDPLRQLELWLRYDEGRIVYIPTKGAARISEVNLKIGVLRLFLKNGEKMSLRINEAERLSPSLAEDHFLTRLITDSATLKQIAHDDPGELLRLFFASVKRELPLGELKEMLSGIIADTEWSKWWAQARKDSRLITGSGKKPMLSWNDSVAEGSAVLMKTFLQASPRDKIAMLKKHAERSATFAQEMATTLADEVAQSLDSDPALALEAGIIITDLPQCGKITLPFSVGELLTRKKIVSIIAGIENRLTRRKALQQLVDTRDDWPGIYQKLLKTETDTSLCKMLYESLHNAGYDDLMLPEIERLFSTPTHGNIHFFLWLCKDLVKREELQQFANWHLIRLLLELVDNSSYKEYLAAMRILFDPGEVIDRAMETLDLPTGRTLLDTVSRSRGLEKYRKDSVRQKLLILFPELQEKKKELLLVTKEALDKKKEEYEKLIRVDIPHAAKEIQRTREYGDLRENFEYHEARRQQELLSSRAKTLHDDLVTARAILPETVDTSKITIGTRCSLQPESADNAPITLTILGPWDSDPANNILSYTSEAGKELLNAAKGSSVSFNTKRYTVDAIDVWVGVKAKPES